MGKKLIKSNVRVVVHPTAKGDYGFMSIGGNNYTFEEEKQLCEDIKDEIIRHVEGTGRNYVGIEYDTDYECEFCGWVWTEGDSPHNGGCCSEDAEIMDEKPEEIFPGTMEALSKIKITND